jgi:hypothetical protein
MALSATPGAVIDTAATRELMAEILARVDRGDLDTMASQLLAKARQVQGVLDPGAGTPDAEQLHWLLRRCFPARRQAAAIVAQVGARPLGHAVADLVWGHDDLAERLDRFDRLLGGFPEVAVDLPWELLHLADPQHHWLWARWMWNPRTDTGALRLVVEDEVELAAPTRVEAYRRVGRALAVVQGTARAVGFVGDGPFAVDAFLACVYGIYMYTVLRMRMTQEFNRIVPELPALARRLLGIYHREEPPCR